jgi:hypothetical protein
LMIGMEINWAKFNLNQNIHQFHKVVYREVFYPPNWL